MTDLDTRYGRSASRRRGLRAGVIAGIVVLVAAAALWVASLGLFSPSGQVDGQATSFRATSDGVRVELEIAAPPGHAVACAVEADADDDSVVGWKVVRLGASADRTRRLTVDVRATAPVAAGLINRCWLT